MTDIHHLFGSCACERNGYAISIPSASTSLAHVYFDNSTSSRRATASPVTAWLRIPLVWYSSATYAQFPDESHASIKRTFETPSTSPTTTPTRRQFCGYCGITLTAWNESIHAATAHPDSAGGTESDYLDVTLGSLLSQSLQQLQTLSIIPESDSDESEEGLEKGGSIDHEDHIPMTESTRGVVAAANVSVRTPSTTARPPWLHRMQGRGVPYFEDMVEHSRLGRIRRQRGLHTSQHGTLSVQWEVVELDGNEPSSSVNVIERGGTKRQRLGK